VSTLLPFEPRSVIPAVAERSEAERRDPLLNKIRTAFLQLATSGLRHDGARLSLPPAQGRGPLRMDDGSLSEGQAP